jgi:N-acyl-phosphatidylethanolamine-hydrolysing phospholipase D
MGPKRYTEIPCEIEEIPYIDAVIISHNHYDHLSHPTVLRIKSRFPNAHFFVPLGNKKWFLDCGIHNVTELDWWESRDITLTITEQKKDGEISAEASLPEVSKGAEPSKKADPESMVATIGCLPCQHTSARTPFDRNHTLWASWMVESGDKKVWFGG